MASVGPGSRRRIRLGALCAAWGVVALLLGLGLRGCLAVSARLRHFQSGEGLGMVRLCLIEYAQDHGGTLPPMGTPARFRAALLPYTKTRSAFQAFDDPSRLYLPNPNLSGRRVGGIGRLTVVAYESHPARADGSRWVAFLPEQAVPVAYEDPDFRGMELMPEAQWLRLKRASGIP